MLIYYGVERYYFKLTCVQIFRIREHNQEREISQRKQCPKFKYQLLNRIYIYKGGYKGGSSVQVMSVNIIEGCSGHVALRTFSKTVIFSPLMCGLVSRGPVIFNLQGGGSARRRAALPVLPWLYINNSFPFSPAVQGAAFRSHPFDVIKGSNFFCYLLEI